MAQTQQCITNMVGRVQISSKRNNSDSETKFVILTCYITAMKRAAYKVWLFLTELFTSVVIQTTDQSSRDSPHALSVKIKVLDLCQTHCKNYCIIV